MATTEQLCKVFKPTIRLFQEVQAVQDIASEAGTRLSEICCRSCAEHGQGNLKTEPQ